MFFFVPCQVCGFVGWLVKLVFLASYVLRWGWCYELNSAWNIQCSHVNYAIMHLTNVSDNFGMPWFFDTRCILLITCMRITYKSFNASEICQLRIQFIMLRVYCFMGFSKGPHGGPIALVFMIFTEPILGLHSMRQYVFGKWDPFTWQFL